MAWTERQRGLLEAMGLRLWLPPAAVDDGTAAAAAAAVTDAARRPAGRARATAAPDPATRPLVSAGLPNGMAADSAAAPANFSAAAAAAATAGAPSAISLAPALAMDWATLRETVAGCTACRLCESRRQTVFGVGHERAHWMIVGEAPGEQEDRLGEPFVGKSGQLLDNMLRAVGLSRSAGEEAGAVGDPARQVYICNTLKCRPPGNRNPEPDELARCEAYLIRQIELVQPRVIVAMGRFAVQGLLRSSEPIGRLRGRVHHYQGLPLIVTYHPAYLLRNCDEKAKAWDDLCLALETVQEQPAAAGATAGSPAPAGRPVVSV